MSCVCALLLGTGGVCVWCVCRRQVWLCACVWCVWCGDRDLDPGPDEALFAVH